jgi:hypothetical protein
MLDQTTIITAANDDAVTDVKNLAVHETYGLAHCTKSFECIFRDYFIIINFECTNDFTVTEEQCLLGRLNKEVC